MDYDEKTCHGCYWAGNCPESSRCDDYTPLDDSLESAYYAKVIQENAKEYEKLIRLHMG